MGYGITDSENYENIAETIREIAETDETYTPAEMPRAILEAAAHSGAVNLWGKILGNIEDQEDLQSALNNKQDVLTFDNTPTENSANPVTSGGVKTALDGKSDPVTKSASGSIVTLTDAADAPVSDMVVAIEPAQDLHGYDAPWPGGSRKNILRGKSLNQTVRSVKFSFTIEDALTVSGTNDSDNANAYFNIHANDEEGRVPISAGTYTLSSNVVIPSGLVIAFAFKDSEGNSISNISLTNSRQSYSATISQDCWYSLYCYVEPSATVSYNGGLQLESGSTATSWIPYSNICPITGWDEMNIVNVGKNIICGYFPLACSITQNKLLLLSSEGTTFYCLCQKGQQYRFSCSATYNRFAVAFFDKMPKIGDSTTIYQSNDNPFTAPISGYMIIYVNNTFDINIVNAAQVEFGSTATTYEPYISKQVSIDLGGTRYSGFLNVTSGELTVTKVFWTRNTSTMNNSENYPGWNDSGIRSILPVGTSGTMIGTISNISPVVKDEAGKNCFVFNTIGSNNIIYLPKTAWNDKSQTEWIADAIDIELVIPLAEPAKCKLTPDEVRTILGTNNIYADTGDILKLDYMTSDATSLVKYIEHQDEKNVIMKSAESGAIAHFYNSAEAPLAGLKIGIEPVQDLHGQSAPYPAGGGKNLFNPNTYETFDLTGSGALRYGHSFSAGQYKVVVDSTNLIYYRIVKEDLSDRGTSVQVTTTPASVTINSGYLLWVFASANDSATLAHACVSSDLTLTTFAPYSNICPITGWDKCNVVRTGKNLYPIAIGADIWSNFQGGTNTNNDDELVVSMSAQLYSGVYSNNYSSAIIKLTEMPVLASYSVDIKASSNTEIFVGFNTKGSRKVQLNTSYQRFTFTGIQFGTKNTFNIYNATTSAVTVYLKDFQFELGTEATAYEPYQGQQVSIDFGDIRYGGSLDVLKGELTVNRKSITYDGSSDEYWYFYTVTQGNLFRSANVDRKKGLITPQDVSCNMYRVSEVRGNKVLSAGPTTVYFDIVDNDISDVPSWRTYLASNNLQVVYTLAEPITIQIDPTNLRTLENENFVWADTGDILSLDYYTPNGKATAEAIDAVKTDVIYDTTQTREMITQSSELAMTASKNYVTGDLLIIGNQLLRAKSNISSGTTITVGNSGNCEVVDLATVISEKSVNGHTHDDRYYTESEINTLFAGKEALKSASGNLVTINDAIDAPAADLKVAIEPVQAGSGDPSPTNVRAISGWDAATIARFTNNQLDSSLVTQATNWVVSTDTGFTKFGGEPVYKGYSRKLYDKWGNTNSVYKVYGIDNSKQYVVTCWWRSVSAQTATGLKVTFFYDDGTYTSSSPTSANETWTRISVTSTSGKIIKGVGFSYNSDYEIYLAGFALVESGVFQEHDSSYVYTNDIHLTTVSFGNTVYGGSLDVTTDVLTVDRLIYRLPRVNSINMHSNSYIKSDACDFYTVPAVGQFYPYPGNLIPTNPLLPECYCNRFKFARNNIWDRVGYPNCFTINNAQLHINIANNLIGVTDPSQETITTVKAKILDYLNALYDSGEYIEFCYKVAPQIVQLTPAEVRTLVGLNNIWADTGDVDIVYCTDTDNGEEVKRTLDAINHKIALLQSQINEMSQ